MSHHGTDMARGPALVGYLITAASTTVVAYLIGWAISKPDHKDWATLAILIAIAILQAELSRGVERLRRQFNSSLHVNMTSVWTFAGALLLPPGLAMTLAVVVHAHLFLRVRKPLLAPYDGALVTLIAMMLSTGLTAGLMRSIGAIGSAEHELNWKKLLLVLVAGALFNLADSVVVGWYRHLLTGQRRVGLLIGSGDDNALEIATLCLGAIIAVTLPMQPLLLALLVVPLLVLHRAVLVKQLERMATIDQKTGLLNAVSWNTAAEHELARAQRTGSTFGLLMVDLDHFKRVNDTHGHLAGDEVLKAVAALLSESTRPYDLVGRFGGEEFVVLVPGVSVQEVIGTAERIRQRVTELHVPVEADGEIFVIDDLSTSVGVATYPEGGATVEAVLQTADTGVYAAKNGGRNRVVSLVNTG